MFSFTYYSLLRRKQREQQKPHVIAASKTRTVWIGLNKESQKFKQLSFLNS